MPTTSSTPKSRLSRAIEIAGAGAPALAQKLAESTGLDVLQSVIRGSFEKSRQLHVEEFFRILSEHLETADLAGVIVELEAAQDNPKLYAAVAEGFDNMRRCLDERAKHAIAVLIAQELHSTDLPTEYFRSCSRMISEEPVDVLEAVCAMLESWIEVSAPETTEPVLCRGNAAGGPFWYSRTKTRDLDYLRSVRPDMKEWFRFSGAFHLRFESHRAVLALERVGYGLRSEGDYQEFGPFNNEIRGSRFLEWDPGKLRWARSFVTALGVIPA